MHYMSEQPDQTQNKTPLVEQSKSINPIHPTTRTRRPTRLVRFLRSPHHMNPLAHTLLMVTRPTTPLAPDQSREIVPWPEVFLSQSLNLNLGLNCFSLPLLLPLPRGIRFMTSVMIMYSRVKHHRKPSI